MGTDYDGVEAFVKEHTPGLALDSNVNPELRIIAPIPFDLLRIPGGVRIGVPESALPSLPQLKAFFYPETQSDVRVIGLEQFGGTSSTSQTEWKLDWPETATHANVHLFYRGRDIDSITVSRWPASASFRTAIDEYFDPERKGLRESLKWSIEKKQDGFELAVVRLLNILGIPAVWYGKAAGPDRADAAALIELDRKKLLLMIECIRQKPDDKFATLAERSRHIKSELQLDADILPVVFTPARAVFSEIRQATQYGVALLGADEISELLNLIAATDVTVEKVLQFLTPSKNIADLILDGVDPLVG